VNVVVSFAVSPLALMVVVSNGNEWAGGGEQAIAGIKGSCERIQQAAASVLHSFEVERDQAA